MNRKYITAALAFATIASLAVAVPVFADTNTSQTNNLEGRKTGMMRPVIMGTVSAISGNTLTVTKQIKHKQTDAAIASLTYTIDATNAVIIKNNATGTIANILVGDIISVQGAVTGTNVVATKIYDGVKNLKNRGPDNKSAEQGRPVGNPVFQGNGQPVVAGSISTVNGNSLTVTTQSGVVYTVDATSAKIVQGPNTITLSNLAVGNTVVIQGTVNGTSITASSILDQVRSASSTGDTSGTTPHKQGFFGGMGSFFSHMFGF